MNRVVALITDSRTLWTLLVVLLILSVGFQIVQLWTGGHLLDTVSQPQQAADIINNMNDAQRLAHLWMTILLDTAYPLTYAALLAGTAIRFAGRPGYWLSIPALAGALVDFVENAVQIMALTSNDSLLWSKAYLTPIKFGLIFLAIAIALTLIITAIFKKHRPQNQ